MFEVEPSTPAQGLQRVCAELWRLRGYDRFTEAQLSQLGRTELHQALCLLELALTALASWELTPPPATKSPFEPAGKTPDPADSTPGSAPRPMSPKTSSSAAAAATAPAATLIVRPPTTAAKTSSASSQKKTTTLSTSSPSSRPTADFSAATAAAASAGMPNPPADKPTKPTLLNASPVVDGSQPPSAQMVRLALALAGKTALQIIQGANPGGSSPPFSMAQGVAAKIATLVAIQQQYDGRHSLSLPSPEAVVACFHTQLQHAVQIGSLPAASLNGLIMACAVILAVASEFTVVPEDSAAATEASAAQLRLSLVESRLLSLLANDQVRWGRPPQTLARHGAHSRSTAVAAQGSILVSGADDGTVALWHWGRKFSLLQSFVAHTDAVLVVRLESLRPSAEEEQEEEKDVDDEGTEATDAAGEGPQLEALDGVTHLDSDPSQASPTKTTNASSKPLPHKSTAYRLVTGSADRTIAVWLLTLSAPASSAVSSSSLGPQVSISLQHRIDSHDGWVRCIALRLSTSDFDCDREAPLTEALLMASGSGDRTVQLHHLSTGQTLHRLRVHNHWVAAVAWANGGRQVVAASADCSMTIMMLLPEGEHRLRLQLLCTLKEAHGNWLRAMAVVDDAGEPGASWLYTGGADGRVRVWHIQPGSSAVPESRGSWLASTGTENKEAGGQHVIARVTAMDASAGGCLLTGSDQGEVALWDVGRDPQRPPRIVASPLRNKWSGHSREAIEGLQLHRGRVAFVQQDVHIW